MPTVHAIQLYCGFFSPVNSRDNDTRPHPGRAAIPVRVRHCYHDAVKRPQPSRLSSLSVATTVALMLAGCGNGPGMFELRGQAMGTSYSIRVVAPAGGPPVPLEALRQRVAMRVEDLEDVFSTWRPDSQVSRFNAREGEEWFAVSPDFLDVLKEAVKVSELTGGAFDPTVGPLVELWGFGAGEASTAVPGREALERMLQVTGVANLQWRESPPAVRRTRPGVRLDFSAIAKGYAVDAVWTLLSEAGLSDYLVEIGGEVRARGRRADGLPWSIGVENPDGSGIDESVPLRDAAVATSGDYRNYFESEGKRYSHVLDPRTGWPVSHDLASVTVIASSATMADALATALLVLGPETGLRLAIDQGLAARLVVRTAEGLQVLPTPAYETNR